MTSLSIIKKFIKCENDRSVFYCANEAVAIINKGGEIIFSNRALRQLAGHGFKKDISGMSFLKLVHNDDLPYVENLISRNLRRKRGASYCEFKTAGPAGKTKYLGASFLPAVKEERIVGLQIVMRDITENRKLHDKLEWSKNHYEHVIDTIQDGICVIDREYKAISANKFFASKVGVPVNKLKGRNFEKLMENYDSGIIAKFGCSLCKEECVVKQSFADGQTREKVCQTDGQRGRPRYYRIRAFPGKDKKGRIFQSVIIIRDVTAIVMSEKEIENLSEFNRRILDNVPVSIAVIDKAGKIKSVNGFFKNLTGEENPVGRKIDDFDFFKQNNLMKLHRRLLAGGRIFSKADCRAVDRQGETRFLNIVAVPLKDSNNRIEGAITMATDSTELVVAKHKVDLLNAELEKKVVERTFQLGRANKELRKALELKSRFISDASHELRTPLTVIQGNLDLAMKSAADKKSDEYEALKLISSELWHMTGILSDLTLLTNSDAADENIRREKVSLPLLVKSACHSMKILAEKKNIRIVVKKIANIKIIGDEDKLEKLLLNLIRNAIKYGRQNGWVKIWAEHTQGGAVSINIKDNGIGIPKDELPFIFERFYRSGHARSMGEGGSGLGLSISKWIAEAHGGFITVESRVGFGSLFTVHLYEDFRKINQSNSLF